MSEPHPILAKLRARRRELGMSKREVHTKARMNRSTFDRREDSLRCPILEQLDRWAATLGYKLTIVKIEDNEMTYWS